MKRATSWALCFIAVIGLFVVLVDFLPQAGLTGKARTEAPAPVAVSSTAYRSASGRHKVSVSDRQLVESFKAQGGRVIADYGGFVLLEASDALMNVAANKDEAQVVDENNLILLNSGAIDTSTSQAQALRSASSGTGKQMRLIQFAGPIKPEWYAKLMQTGARVVSYIPNNAYLVYGGSKSLQAVQALGADPSVQWDGPYSSVQRLAPSIATRSAKGSNEVGKEAAAKKGLRSPLNRSALGNELFAIQLIADESENATTLDLIEQLKLEPVVRRSRVLDYVNVVVALTKDSVINQLAKRGDVVSIAPWSMPHKMDERQDFIIATGAAPAPGDYLAYLAGKGFSTTTTSFGVNISDSGVDNGSTTPNHFGLYSLGDPTVPANSRIVYARVVGTPTGPGSTTQACDGHGNLNTHVIGGYVPTGTVGGVNFGAAPHADASGFRYGLGVLPFVKIGSSVIFDNSGAAGGDFTSPDFTDLESRAYNDTMRISSNSWGASNNSYTIDSQEYDALVRDAQPTGATVSNPGNQEYTILFAAGNDGSGANTVGEPGTAKNVITVGASENVQAFGGADQCGIGDTGADSINDMISFSSRGPTSDGRKKPDIVAPGTHVSGGVAQASIASPTGSGTGAQLACFNGSGVCGGVGSNFFPAGQQWYTASSGTSHSTPAMAGYAALIRQYFINQALTPPTPAMTKALMLNSARYMTGTGANDTLPSNSQGMGEANFNSFFDLFTTGSIRRDEVAADKFTASGQQRIITGSINTAAKAFRVTLAWTDPPGPTSGNAFVNNLDLEVTVGGNTYKGNVFSGANSATGGSADTRNNVESVFVPPGVTGNFVIKVKATNIAGDGVPGDADALDQDFALVVFNATSASLPVIQSGTASITAESCAPANSAIDTGETVTVDLPLSNVGTADTVNLTATLQATGGVTSPSGAQVYGVVMQGGPPVSKAFTFTADPSLICGSVLTATLHLMDGASDLGNVTFTFQIGALGSPSTALYTTGNIAVPIPDVSSVDIPITISQTGSIADVNARVRLNHTFDQDLVLELIAPDGTTVSLAANRDTAAGGGDNYGTGANDCSGTPTIFDDSAATPISGGLPPFAGTFRPETPLSDLNGHSLAGTWKLRVTDTAAIDTGTVGCFTLEITRQPFVCCGIAGQPIINSGGAATVTAENFFPANNTPDPGETVTATFPVINVGDGNTTNLVGTMQTSGGITPSTAFQNYGVVVASGPAVSRPFTFVANGACGSMVTASIQFQDGAMNLGTVTYTFQLGTTSNSSMTFSNPATITIPASGTGATTGAPSTPYPSNITVAGAPTQISKITVSLSNFNHTFPDDVDFLLVSPTGRKMIIMSDAGSSTIATNFNFTLDDDAATALPDGTGIASGTFKPSNYGTVQDPFPAPAPAGPYLTPQTGGTDTLTSAFTGVAGGDPNGTWSLYIVDDAATDTGTLAGGWSITLTSSTQVCATSTALKISEFRERGPAAANDEFVEFYNAGDTPITVQTSDASAGWAVVSSDGITRFVIPNGTVIPARGHYLAANSLAYSTGGYATPDITFATDIPDNSGLALFNSATSLILANRLDAVGFTTSAALYKEGAGLTTLTAFSTDFTEYRDLLTGYPKDTDDNVADFRYVDTNGTLNGGQQRLGAPGPENLASAIHNTTGSMIGFRIDPSNPTSAAPNFVFDPTSLPAQNASFGSILIRRTFINNTGAPLTRLRFRIVDLSTFPSTVGTADLRPRTSAGGSVPIGGTNPACPGGNCPMQALTLEQPPSQPNGGGFNSSLGANTVTLATPLANGAGINVEFLLGIQQVGCYRLVVIAEALPGGASEIFGISGSAGPAGSCSINPTTAAPASISGRITSPDGAPLAGVSLRLSGQQSASAITDSLGNYQFENVSTDGFYTVTPELANYRFAPATRSFSLVADKTDAVFTGSPDVANSANPIDTNEFFVRQQYLDFLGREPDYAGLNYWTTRLSECNGEARCLLSRRLDVSAAFFMSDEFKATGSYVYKLYAGALGRQLTYGEFSSDRQQVVGGPDLAASKAAFAAAFVGRPEFAARYQASGTADTFVDALLRSISDASGANLSTERANLISRYNSGSTVNESRALVLQDVTENAAFSEAVHNPSFVLMEYFGYLRRDRDRDGYEFWLSVLNTRDAGNYRGMVCSFTTSTEYQRRFGSQITRSNADCSR